MVTLTINGKHVQADPGMSVFEAAKANNIMIPHLCYLEDVHQIGACRICVVEIEGARTLQASCMVPVREGMVVRTNTARVKHARKVLYELMLSDHPRDCLSCLRNQNCEFQRLGELIQIPEFRFEGERSKTFVDLSSPSIVRDSSKCILCRRCVTVCNEVQDVGVLNVQKRGFHTIIGPADELPLAGVSCTNCGQCVMVCPVGALLAQDATERTWQAIFDPNKRVVVQTAPAVRVALGEEFGYPPGTIVTGKMASALREIGFDDIFDTNFGADLTIIEEGHEFLKRITAAVTGGNTALPMITSCSPGWIKYIEHEFPGELDHLSSCKSPHMMVGALVKTYYAEKIGVDPKDMYVVSVMPCTAKKFEITRPEMFVNGMPAVDAVVTTRELARMIRDAGVEFRELPDGRFDDPLGFSTGAADIFGATGGVMEAALRTVYEVVTSKELPRLDLEEVRGLEGVKEAAVDMDGTTVKVAVAHGLANARHLMEKVKNGTADYQFIEIMCCPGGCIGGGGQPFPTNTETRTARMRAIYEEDQGMAIRKSHENPAVKRLYEEYLGEPLGEKSHHLLHTHYTMRKKH